MNFQSYPAMTEAYFVQRGGHVPPCIHGVEFASFGFFVVGMGIFLLGVRVGYGVLVGRLDLMPVKRREIEVKKVEV